MSLFFSVSGIRRRWSAFALSVIFFWSNVLAVHAGEASFWAERRNVSRRMHGVEAKSGATGFGLTAEQYQTLTQLPKAGQLNPGSIQGGSSVGSGLAVPPPVSNGFRPFEHPTLLGDTPTWVSQLILPYGSILEAHLAKKPNAPFIVHIQDAHGIEEAQKNMAAMIEGLSENRGLSLVGVEAAQGPFNMGPYRDWPDANVTRDVATYFLKEGTIGGAEFAGITAPKPLTLWGIEDTDLYLANVHALMDANKLKPELTKALAGIKRSVSSLKETIYSKELKDFDKHFQAHQDQREGLGAYVRFLTAGSLSNKKGLPNLHLLVKALMAEEALDFKQVEKERLKLVERLALRLAKDKLDLLVQKSFQYRAGQIGYGDYHRFLKSLCRENGISLGDLNQLDNYIEYVLLADKIDRNNLLNELTRAEKASQDRLAITSEQKKLVAVARRLALLEKLSTHIMTPDDWAAFEKEREHILTIASDLATLSGEEQTLPPDTLAALLSPSEHFCRYAIDRNAAFIANLSAQMETKKASSAVLVAGGFHSDGLTRLLQERDLSYVVVTPKITEVPKENNYLDVFARDPLPLEKLFTGEKIFLRYAATLGARPIPGFEPEALRTTLRILVRQYFNQGREPKKLHKALAQTGYSIQLVQDSGRMVDFRVNGKPLRVQVSEDGAVNAVRSPLHRRVWSWWASRSVPDRQMGSPLPIAPPLMSMGYSKYLTLIRKQEMLMKTGGSLTGWERFLLWFHNPLKGGPVAETALLGVLGIVGKAGLGMTLMDPLGLTWASFAVFLIIGAFFSLGHPDLYARLTYRGSDYNDGKLKMSAFIRELGKRIFVVFGQRFVAGAVMAGLLLMLPPVVGVALAWAFHEIWNIGVALRWPLFRSLRYLFMSARTIEGGSEEGIEAEVSPSVAEKTDPYIYDPVMRRSIIARLSTQNGFVDPSKEFTAIHEEVKEIFQKVLKAAHDRLIREGKAKQAEGLLNADLFLADNEEVNAYALIYFNFVGINTGLLKELHKNGVLTKDLIAFILAHEVTHLIQYREDVDAGKVEAGLSFNNLDGLIKRKFHEKVDRYAKEQDADVRAVDLVNEAGYSMGEITVFFDLMTQNSGVRNRFFTMMDDHPLDTERSTYLRKIRRRGNWKLTTAKTPFSDAALEELSGPRSQFRMFQESLWAVDNLDDVVRLALEAETPDSLSAAATWGLHRAMWKIAERMAKEDLDAVFSPGIRGKLKDVLEALQSSAIYRGGIIVENERLWLHKKMDFAEESDLPEAITFLLYSYLATGLLPTWNVRADHITSQIQEVSDAILELLQGDERISAIVAQRDATKNAIGNRAEKLAQTSSDALSFSAAKLLLAGCPSYAGNEVEPILEGLRGLAFDKVLTYFTALSPVRPWGMGNQDLGWEVRNFISDFNRGRETLAMSSLEGTAVLLAGQAQALPIGENIALLEAFQEKEREFLKNDLRISRMVLENLVRMVASGSDAEQELLVRFLLEHPGLHGDRNVAAFLYAQWSKSPDSPVFADVLAGSPRLRHAILEEYGKAINSRNSGFSFQRIPYENELLEGRVDKVLKLFQPNDMELYLFLNEVQKMSLQSPFAGRLEQWRGLVRVAYRRKGKWIPSKGSPINSGGLLGLLGEIDPIRQPPENELRTEATKVLARAGFAEGADSLPISIIRCILFFEAGGIERPLEFRHRMEKLLREAGTTDENLTVLARFLNSDYMYSLQEERGMPSLFAIENMEKVEVAEGIIKNIFVSEKPSPEEVIVNRGFYRAHTWGEYIAHFNTLVHLRVTGQSAEYNRLLQIDQNPERFRGFAGEFTESAIEKPDIVTNPLLGKAVQKEINYTAGIKKILSRLFERVFRRLISSSPKYVDRRDLSAALEDGSLFRYVLESSKTFDALLAEAKELLPRSVYRNYWLLHLLARRLHEEDSTFELSRTVDLVRMKQHLEKRHRQGKDLVLFYQALEQIVPLLVRDPRMETMNEGLLAFWALKRSGKKMGGVGDPIKEEISPIKIELDVFKSKPLQIIPLAEEFSPENSGEDRNLLQKTMSLIRGVARRAVRLVTLPFGFVGDLAGFLRLYLRMSYYQVWFNTGLAKNGYLRSANKLVKLDEPSTDLNYLAVQVKKQLSTDLFQAINRDRPAMRFLRWLLSSAESVRSRTRGVFAKVISPIFDVVQVTSLFFTLLYLRAWYSSGFARERYKKFTRKLVEQRSLWATNDEENNIDEAFSVPSLNVHELRTLVENHLLESILHGLQKENWAMRMLRESLLAVNRRLHPSGNVDFFYFDFQAKQTQLDTGLAGLANEKIEADMGSSIDFDEKIRALFTYFPRPSPSRDRLLEILAEHEISKLDDKNPSLLVEHLNKVRLLFANDYFNEKFALRAFELERRLRPDLFVWDASLDPREDVATLHRDFIERNVSLAKSYFRPGYLRDDILLAILEETWTYDEYTLIKPLLYQYKGSLLKEEEAAKTSYYEDKIKLFLADANPGDKKDFLLWVLGAKGKPLFLREWEYYLGINLDRVRDIFRDRGAVSTGGLNLEQVGVSAKKEMIHQMFAGEGGILDSPAVFDDFMNAMFDHVVPRQGKIPREKLRTILRVILEKSDSNRRVEIVQSLAVNLAGALAGEKLDQNQVIARFFESLGLVGVKMAQTLAHSYDIELDQELRKSLSALSSRADPLSKMVVFETIENMYEGGFAANFESVKNSLGSASIKIVYRARKIGAKEDIALKVKRPAVDQSLEADMAFLTAVLKALREEGFSIPLGMENRISGAISKDADFEEEADITRRFEKQFRDEKETYALNNGTPVDFEIAPIAHVTRNVMETELAAGGSLDREDEIVSQGIATPQEFEEVKRIVFDMLMRQVFRHGYYLADPHGGNFHLTRKAGRLKVIFIDSGSAEKVVLENRQDLLEAMIWLAVNPGRSIPQEYLYTSVFFAKLGYLREGVPHIEMLRIILKYLEVKDGDRVLSAEEYMAKLQSRFAKEMTAREKVSYLWQSWKRKKPSPQTRPTLKSMPPLPESSPRAPTPWGGQGLRGVNGLSGALHGEKALFDRGFSPLFAAVHGLVMESEGVLREVTASLERLGFSQTEWMNPLQWPEIIRKATLGGIHVELIQALASVLSGEGMLRERKWEAAETAALEKVQQRLATVDFPGVKAIEYVQLTFDASGSAVDPATGAGVKMDTNVFMGFDMGPDGTLRVFVHPEVFNGAGDPAAFLLDAMMHEILEGPGGVEHSILEDEGIGMDRNIDWQIAEARISSVQLRLATNLLERWSREGDPDALIKLAMVGAHGVNWDGARPATPVGAMGPTFALAGDRGQRALRHITDVAETAGMDSTLVERLLYRGLLVAGWRAVLAEAPGAFRYVDVSPLDEAPGSENRLACETLLSALEVVVAADPNPTKRAQQIIIGCDNPDKKTFVESRFPTLKGSGFKTNRFEGKNIAVGWAATEVDEAGASSLRVHTLRELNTDGTPPGINVERSLYSLNTIMQKALDSIIRVLIAA